MKARAHRLSDARVDTLRANLDRFLTEWRPEHRLENDPIELPHRYRDPRDIEVSALLASSLAYGRVDLFKPKVTALLDAMGSSPARFVASLDLEGAAELLDGFVYRFNLGADVAVLLLGAGAALRRYGSLEAPFVEALEQHASLHTALDAFIRTLRDVDHQAIASRLGRTRGLNHLLPSPLGAGAAKRLNLFLRWMVRGPDAVDFGIWKRVQKSALLIPLDTHIHRIARLLGLTKRNDLTWRTAEEITATLRRLDPIDPVRYDFALCHYGMSGACPLEPMRESCAVCALRTSCRVGKRLNPETGRRSAGAGRRSDSPRVRCPPSPSPR